MALSALMMVLPSIDTSPALIAEIPLELRSAFVDFASMTILSALMESLERLAGSRSLLAT